MPSNLVIIVPQVCLETDLDVRARRRVMRVSTNVRATWHGKPRSAMSAAEAENMPFLQTVPFSSRTQTTSVFEDDDFVKLEAATVMA